ncbi:hypothetical protein K1719_009201 [Acacia pycnantha]|nr:hypothetical protein K1719_009201 [Acacia pycnantha]
MVTPKDYEFYVAIGVLLKSLTALNVDADLVIIASVDVPARWFFRLLNYLFFPLHCSVAERTQFDSRQYDEKMNEFLSTDGEEFFTSYDEVYDTFDAMELQENLLRGF